MKLIEQICKLWWVEAGRGLTDPYSNESIKALELVLREDFDFSDDVVEYVMESIMRTPTHFKKGGDRDSGVDVDDDETAVSAILSRDELIALEQHSEFLDEIDASKLVSNPNPKGRKKMVTYGYAQQWLDDNPDAVPSDDYKKDIGQDDDSDTDSEKDKPEDEEDKPQEPKVVDPKAAAKKDLKTGSLTQAEKDAKDDEIEKQSDLEKDDKPEPQANGYVGNKDKTLKQGDVSKTEEYQRDLPPDDKEFTERNKKFANPIPPEPYKIPEDLVKNPKFPKKYLTALERMVNTKPKGNATKWKHFSDIAGGAGQISAQAGELMTMMGASMNDEEFESFTNSLLEHEKSLIENNPSMKKEGSRIVTKSWIDATKQSRKAIRDRIIDQYGEGTEIIATAWDTKSDVEAMGLTDYEKNKGFSTDMYMKVRKPDGTEVMDEISLKKSTKVNFLNSGAGSFEKWDKDLPDEINQKVYRTKARQRNVDFIKNNRKDVEDFIKSDNGVSIRKLMESKGLTLEEALEGNSRNKQNVLFSCIKEMGKNGNKDAQAIKDTDDKNHNEFCKKSVEAIVDNPKMKAGMLKDIRNEFPLKAVSDGEETMAIGPYSLDKKTMEKIFGTSDYEKLKENLVAESGPPPYVGYKIESSGETFAIADINVREDGRGYGGQFKFEMTLNQKSFAKRLEQAQSEVYGKE